MKFSNWGPTMKCSNCGKQVPFLLAWKVRGTFGHYCSVKCAQDANVDAFTSKSDVYQKAYRGGLIECIVGLILLPWWICKLIKAIISLPFTILRAIFGKKKVAKGE